jgi:hypothetical protein
MDSEESFPSPMLSVTGLVLESLEPHVKKTHLPEHSKHDILMALELLLLLGCDTGS